MYPKECQIAKPTEEFKCIARHQTFMCTCQNRLMFHREFDNFDDFFCRTKEDYMFLKNYLLNQELLSRILL